MKKYIQIISLLIVTISFGQIPAGYYNTATGTGYTLKTQLYNIINGHTDQGYGGLYTTYQTSDKDFFYENNGSLLDMYTENPTGSECEFTYGVNQDDGTLGTAECQRYNREHLVPQSVFGSATPMYSDAHFVVPSDKYVNAQRGDFPFGRVNVANNTYTNGSKRGSNLNSGYSAGYSGTVFEPIDEFKGDIARMLLYFAVRYENQVASWSYPMFNGTSNQVFTSNAINVLLTWHNNDPVSVREVSRNNAIYNRQNNRNPFIDHPEYAMSIWGSLLQNDTFESIDNAITIYPNPSNDNKVTIESTIEINDIQLFSINGQLIMEMNKPTINNNSYTLDNLPKGFYFMKLSSENQSTIKKIIVN
ncbi:endonuclease [Flavobacterium sp.]|uniref:endonuclease n=1 Tax=Flavobacterium sp. TaxID=239 RepID=UPI0026217BE5|nr:endonuclease [Flavobacterium sp.]